MRTERRRAKMFGDVKFAYPWVLYFLAIIPAMIFWYWRIGAKRQTSLTYSSLKIFQSVPPSWKERARHLPVALRSIATAILIIALARPQSFSTGQNVTTEGIDIVLAVDISGSMRSEDFKPNRVDAAKSVADKFIDGRPNDRIGLVIFAGEAFTQCPITIDHRVLKDLLQKIDPSMLPDGTAIGNGIADAVGRLKDGQAKSKIIILLTDGASNAGEIDPRTAAEIAKTYGIRVYTICVGTGAPAPYPVQTPYGLRYQMVSFAIDEGLLKDIADITGGQAYVASNNRTLEEIYKKIDQLEKSRIEVTSYRNAAELFPAWLNAGLLILLLELSLSKTILRKSP